MAAHTFLGNVRELKNIIVRALIESDGQDIYPEHLHFISTTPSLSPSIPVSISETDTSEIPINLNEAEAYLIRRALAQVDGNISEAARLLGISRKRIYRKLEQDDV
ncbi:MAG: DUF134 domain-containing protein [Candidatus Poribacteria bacterium]|nr:DUF134 domain-containing protein [Candidatus Poribacteria bacterium]